MSQFIHPRLSVCSFTFMALLWTLYGTAYAVVTIEKDTSWESWKPALSPEARHHLKCFLKHHLFPDTEASGGRYCCLPKETFSETCAVVSNSGVLREHSLGEQIDSHQYVIRLNDAPIKGYERHVGKRASYRFGWNASPRALSEAALKKKLLSGLRSSSSKFVALDSEFHNETYLKCLRSYDEFRSHYPEATVFPYKCEERGLETVFQKLYPSLLGRSSVGNPYLSTGGRALMLALSSCSQVAAYGFTPIQDQGERKWKTKRFHYYGTNANDKKKVLTDHIWFDAEHDLWIRLSDMPVNEIFQKGVLTMTGLRTLTGCDNSTQTHPGFLKSWSAEMNINPASEFNLQAVADTIYDEADVIINQTTRLIRRAINFAGQVLDT